MGFDQIVADSTGSAHRHPAMRTARRRLRVEHEELAARMLEHPAVVLHHPVASLKISAAAQRAGRMDFGVDRGLGDDGELKLQRNPKRTFARLLERSDGATATHLKSASS